MALNHLKPHGALYGAAWSDEDVATACAEVAQVFGIPMYGTTGTLHETVWPRYTTVVWEIFADLDYDDEGRCIITRAHESVAPERAVEQVMRAVEKGMIRSVNGKDVPTRAETICVHSDTPGAVAVAKAVRAAVAPYIDSPEA